jgi:hypothetical protein
VILPGPGAITGSGRNLIAKRSPRASASKAISAPGTVKLTIRAKGKARKKLKNTGKAKLKLTVTFTPTGGDANSHTKKITLRRKPR